MIIRKAKIEDIFTLSNFQLQKALETENVCLDSKTVTDGVKAMIHNEQMGFYLVAEHEHSILGTLMVTYEWSDWRNNNIWWLQSVYVSINNRKQGVFRLMFDEIKFMAKCAGIKTIRLYVEANNEIAINTYLKNDFYKTYYIMLEKSID